jgi:hypothetical protein
VATATAIAPDAAAGRQAAERRGSRRCGAPLPRGTGANPAAVNPGGGLLSEYASPPAVRPTPTT